MKLNTRSLALRTEEKLKTLVPAHIIRVTHNSTEGVKVKAIIGSQTKEYIAGLSWTTCDMTCDKIARDYIAARYPEKQD
jgi:hypothetical protein